MIPIGGLQRFSSIDYPGLLCATIFTQGCNFRCPYCHNPELVKKDLFRPPLSCTEVIDFLKSRINKLDGVCVTGGEPTIHGQNLKDFLEEVKKLGLLVKLDTNGTNPELLEELLKKRCIDYVAMDVKAPLSGYAAVTRSPIDTYLIHESIRIIMNYAQEYEFRTTVIKSLLTRDDLGQIGILLKGARRYVLQRFVSSRVLDLEALNDLLCNEYEVEQVAEEMRNYVESVAVR
ncbi:MAG: anaerobic ribonucleoside-triphosphate reductase activating protein [Syntrophales bacterium]|jgi:pyruvate formate lyase activating enzyme|nr:anaerobic ribonucleoside-triphosphate reductase activating protein [Syntrophales bacterium]